MLDVLKELRKKVAIGFVGGSDFAKISEQLSNKGSNGKHQLPAPFLTQTYDLNRGTRVLVVDDFDFAFAENGLTAYRLGKKLESQSFIKAVGEERYKKLANFILHYVADLDIPIKRHAHVHSLSEPTLIMTIRGTFIEFRNGMINVSPIGRNAT
jgi:phosphomannomutase